MTFIISAENCILIPISFENLFFLHDLNFIEIKIFYPRKNFTHFYHKKYKKLNTEINLIFVEIFSIMTLLLYRSIQIIFTDQNQKREGIVNKFSNYFMHFSFNFKAINTIFKF